jgi:DNA-binding CsgD family transcriptional regulator
MLEKVFVQYCGASGVYYNTEVYKRIMRITQAEKKEIQEVLELWQSGKTPEEVLAILGVDEDSIDT